VVLGGNHWGAVAQACGVGVAGEFFGHHPVNSYGYRSLWLTMRQQWPTGPCHHGPKGHSHHVLHPTLVLSLLRLNKYTAVITVVNGGHRGIYAVGGRLPMTARHVPARRFDTIDPD